MKKRFSKLAVLILPLALTASVGCDVDVDEPGRLPDVDVDVSGDPGALPDLDVDGPEVTTGEKTVTVPTVDIDIPDEDDNELENDDLEAE